VRRAVINLESDQGMIPPGAALLSYARDKRSRNIGEARSAGASRQAWVSKRPARMATHVSSRVQRPKPCYTVCARGPGVCHCKYLRYSCRPVSRRGL